MNITPGTLLSRLVTIYALLCMALMLHAGLAATQSTVLNIQHLVSGDLQLADGGWAKACDGDVDDCDGHLVPPHSDDSGPVHHHHPGGESQFGAAAGDLPVQKVVFATGLNLRPGEATRLAGRYVSTPDQPPRA